MTKENIKKVINYLDFLFPIAKTELEFENPFQLLVAIIMSAQTTDKQVNKVNKKFFSKFKTPSDLVQLWEKFIKNEIKTIWLNNSKAKNIFFSSKMLCEKYSEKIPETLEEIIKLPWVWVKTWKVWLSIIKNAPYLAVDTHVHRVLNRLWIVNTKTPLETDKKAEKILSKEDLAHLHHTLILFWRYHCTARNPKCDICELKSICKWYKKQKNPRSDEN